VNAVATATINVGTDYTLLVAPQQEQRERRAQRRGPFSVSPSTSLSLDGSLGLFARRRERLVRQTLLIKGNDPAFTGGGTPQLAAGTPKAVLGPASGPLTGADLGPDRRGGDRNAGTSTPNGARERAALRESPVRDRRPAGAPCSARRSPETVVNRPDPPPAFGWFVDTTPLPGRGVRRAAHESPAARPSTPRLPTEGWTFSPSSCTSWVT